MSADGGLPGAKDAQPDLSTFYNTDRPVSELRKELEDRAGGRPLQPGTEFETVSCHGVPCEWIATPPAVNVIPASGNAVYFHVHGGGYYRGSTRVAAPLCSNILAASGIRRCLSVNYRTAPEHPYPAALDDTYSAYTWLTSEGGASPADIVCGGDSAGGGLIMGLLLKLRDHAPHLLPSGAIPFSPWTDMTQSGRSFATNADTGVPNCSKDYLDFWGGKYLGGADPLTDPYVSPNHCDLAGLCPLFVQVGGAETMLDMAADLVHKAARARVEVSLEVFDMEGHVFQNDWSRPNARIAVAHCADFARRMLARQGPMPSQPKL
eukprot:SAG31_NODE_413_length_15971_cov_7.706842_9_plen_321_part_00